MGAGNLRRAGLSLGFLGPSNLLEASRHTGGFTS